MLAVVTAPGDELIHVTKRWHVLFADDVEVV